MRLLARVAAWLVVGFALLVVLALFQPFIETGAAVVGSVLFGWFSFLNRVLPGVTIKWSGVGMVALCSILIVVGIHSFCGWMSTHAAASWNKGAALKWRWSWTVSLYLSIWLLFAAIMGAVGVAHQLGWLLRSDEPMFKRRRYESMLRNELYQYGGLLEALAKEARWNLEETRWMFFESSTSGSSLANIAESHHVVLLKGTNGAMAAGAIFHRDPETRLNIGFILVSPEVEPEIKPIEEFPAFLSRYQPQSGSKPK